MLGAGRVRTAEARRSAEHVESRAVRIAAQTEGVRATRLRAWLFTVVLVLSILLAINLLILPYEHYQWFGDQVYHNTRGAVGLDPRDWAPFAPSGVGSFLYTLSFPIFWFVMLGLPVLIVGQLLTLCRTWQVFNVVARIAHLLALSTAILVSTFMLGVGHWIIDWLLD